MYTDANKAILINDTIEAAKLAYSDYRKTVFCPKIISINGNSTHTGAAELIVEDNINGEFRRLYNETGTMIRSMESTIGLITSAEYDSLVIGEETMRLLANAVTLSNKRIIVAVKT